MSALRGAGQIYEESRVDSSQMDSSSIGMIVALLILVAMSAYFSATETAFTSLNRIRLKSKADDGDLRAAKTLAMAEDYDKLLSTILIGNNIVNNAATTISAVLFIKLMGQERGPALSRRVEAVENFECTGTLDPNANIQFGEGGAGTFSDGKLTTRVGDPLCAFVTEAFLRHGAPEDIAWRQKPHVGTDLLRGVITGIRAEIEQLGGEVLFDTALTGLNVRGGVLESISTTAGEIACDRLILAVGHSARDTFAMLHCAELPLECKPFSVGFRAEHLQTDIDQSLYHGAAGHPALPKGEYQLSQHVGSRCVYTFCMCPGGQVCAAASEDGGVVTNGMSYHARDGRNANAAVVVSVDGSDFDQNPTVAVAFQRRLEQAAFRAGGGAYRAPAETVGSFLEGRGRLELDRVQPTYPRGVTPCDLGSLLPGELAGDLRTGLQAFGRKLAAYRAPDAVLTGLETRTSSPVRLLRGDNLQCISLPGLYPCGEGAGYAGGIMTAAVDGVRCAAALMRDCAPAKNEEN